MNGDEREKCTLYNAVKFYTQEGFFYTTQAIQAI